MASHEFQIVLRRTPSDPPDFPDAVTLVECMWCKNWYVSKKRELERGEIPRAPDFTCPYCHIDSLNAEIQDSERTSTW